MSCLTVKPQALGLVVGLGAGNDPVSNVSATIARVRGPAHAPPPALRRAGADFNDFNDFVSRDELPVCLISTDKRKTKLTSGTGHSSAPDAYSERSAEALPRLSVTSRVDVRRVMLRAGAPFVIAPCYCPLVVAGWRTRTLHDPTPVPEPKLRKAHNPHGLPCIRQSNDVALL